MKTVIMKVIQLAVTEISMRVYESILETEREWRFDGQLKRPTYEDVATLLDRMIEQVRKSPGSISI
jgi:hypothetical protein